MPDHVQSAIGPLEILEEDGVKLAIVGKRKCTRCGAPLLMEKVAARWAKVFVEECYNYCCKPCCPRSGGTSCPIALTQIESLHE
jgi:hypothetical protein